MSPSLRLVLHILGAIGGLIAWGIVGIGLSELGILSHFDPIGVLEDPPEHTLGVKIIERSLPVFVVLGAWLTPGCIRWLIRPPDQPPES